MSLSRRTRRVVIVVGAVGLTVAAAGLVLTSARPGDRPLPDHDPDPVRGEVMYHAGGCISCHKASATTGVTGLPIGGAEFPTPVGSFWPGNLTPDPETGLGRWTTEEFVDSMMRGVSPDGRHYFPAFPYTSYRDMNVEDVLDLWAYLKSLEPTSSPGRTSEVPFEFLARRGVGMWKLLALDDASFRPQPAETESWNRGAYLTKTIGHCGECHTPRNALMIPDREKSMAGGPHPRGDEGAVPSLLDLEGRGRYTDAADLTLALQFGETFGYDRLSSGGMADIQMNLAMLPEEDLRAIAEYLLSLD